MWQEEEENIYAKICKNTNNVVSDCLAWLQRVILGTPFSQSVLLFKSQHLIMRGDNDGHYSS